MRMLFHDWTPPPIMITKEKLNTYPPLFSKSLPQRRGRLFAYMLEQANLLGVMKFIIIIYLKIYCLRLVYMQLYTQLFIIR